MFTKLIEKIKAIFVKQPTVQSRRELLDLLEKSTIVRNEDDEESATGSLLLI